MTTPFLTDFPRYASAVSFILASTIPPIWDGEYFWPRDSTQASPLVCWTILYGTSLISLWHSGSENFRPIRRFVAKRVFSGLTTACRFADTPTSRSPPSVKATTDGVVLVPSAFSIILGCLPSMMATAELVVPKSIPMTAPLTFSVDSGASVDAYLANRDDRGIELV